MLRYGPATMFETSRGHRMSAKLDRRAFIGAALAFGALCYVEPTQAFGVTSAEKKAEVQAVKAKLDAISTEVEEAAEGYNAAMIAYEEATAKVAECQEKITAAEEEIATLQASLETRATAMYRNGSMSYLDVLLGAGSFDDFATLWDTLNSLNEDDADLVASTKLAKAELESAKAELDEQEAEAEAQLAAAKEYQATAEAQQAAYEEEYSQLSAEYQELLAAEQEAEEAALAAAAAAYTPAHTTTTTSDDDDSSSSSSSSSGDDDSSSSSSGDDDSSSSSGGYASYSGSSAAVSRAYAELGKPYGWGGVGPDYYDCSGLVSYCISGAHTRIYTAAALWSHASCDEVEGAPVACSSSHCGLAIGGSRMIHAPQTGDVVKISALRGHCVVP